MFFMRKSLSLPSAEQALPGRATPLPTAKRHFVNGHASAAALSRGHGTARCSGSAVSGARSASSGNSATASTSRRSAMPAATRRTRPMRKSASGRTGHTEAVLVVFDPARDFLRAAAEDVLGEPRPDPGHASGQRRRHAISLGDLHHHRRAAARGAGFEGRLWQGAGEARASARSPPRSRRPASSISPRTIISNIWRRIPAGYCGLGGTGVSLSDRHRRQRLKAFRTRSRPRQVAVAFLLELSEPRVPTIY